MLLNYCDFNKITRGVYINCLLIVIELFNKYYLLLWALTFLNGSCLFFEKVESLYSLSID